MARTDNNTKHFAPITTLYDAD